jgi:hypothetical protein
VGTVVVSTFHDAAAVLSAEGVDAAAEPLVVAALKRAADAVQRAVRQELAPHKRTGKTAKRVRVKAEGAGFDLNLRVAAGGAANLIVGGVRPHGVRASDPKHPLPIGGGRFAASAQPRGFRGDPVFARGVAASEPEVSRIIATAAERLAHDLAEDITRKGR